MLYARVEHIELWAIIVIYTAYQQRLTLIRQYCLMKQPGPTLHDRIHGIGSTDVLRTQVASGCLFLQL